MIDFFKERYELAMERVHSIWKESCGDEAVRDYFSEVAAFLVSVDETSQSIQPHHYERSYANPTYAVEKLGPEFGKLLSAIYGEVRYVIVAAERGSLEEILIRTELFLEVYSEFAWEWREGRKRPDYESIRRILYWYVSDYSDITAEAEVEQLLKEAQTDECMIWEDMPEAYSLEGILRGIVPKRKKEGTFYSQYATDHRNDRRLVWDKAMVKRRLEVLKTACEQVQEHCTFEQKNLLGTCYQAAEMLQKGYLQNC